MHGTLGGGFQAERTVNTKVLRQEHDRYVCWMGRWQVGLA